MKVKNTDRVITRLEHELASIQRAIEATEGRMSDMSEGDYEYGILARSLRSLVRREHKLNVELDQLAPLA